MRHISYIYIPLMLICLASCNHTNTIREIGGRQHNIEQSTFLFIPYNTNSTIIKSKDEIKADQLVEAAKLKAEMERKVAEAEADKQAAKDRADAFETKVGSLTKLVGFALIALGFIAHLFISSASSPKMSEWASKIYVAGAVVVVVGIVIKWSVGWELWLLIASMVIGAPLMYVLRKKGIKKGEEK